MIYRALNPIFPSYLLLGSLGKHEDQLWPICLFSCQSGRLIPPQEMPEIRQCGLCLSNDWARERGGGERQGRFALSKHRCLLLSSEAGHQSHPGAVGGDSSKDVVIAWRSQMHSKRHSFGKCVCLYLHDTQLPCKADPCVCVSTCHGLLLQSCPAGWPVTSDSSCLCFFFFTSLTYPLWQLRVKVSDGWSATDKECFLFHVLDD